MDTIKSPQACNVKMKAVMDSLDALNGKWKIPILISLTFGTKRFKEISNDISKVTDRMLSKELKELEMNQLITRTVQDSFPPVVNYAITEHGRTLQTVIDELGNWGVLHRNKILKR
jgi:DNA-binding HxlR family transcriptional regulator